MYGSGIFQLFQAHSVAGVLEKYNNSKKPDNILNKVNVKPTIFYLILKKF